MNDVPSNQTYIGIPARKVRNKKELGKFNPYGITEGRIDDPNKTSILGIVNEYHELSFKFKSLEKEIKKIKLKVSKTEDFTKINEKISQEKVKKWYFIFKDKSFILNLVDILKIKTI